MAGAAQGAVDSLLGQLTSMLLDEAQLLGGLRGDVEFIRDEMETMNGLLRHLTDAHHRNHLVRAWMKQVVGLARDCEGNVELYLHRVGGGPAADPHAGNCLLRYLRQLLRLLQGLPARHRIATRIRELKVRARDVGDRRLRYGVTVPADDSVLHDDNIYDGNDNQSPRTSAGQEEDLRRRGLLLDAAEPPPDAKEVVRRGVESLMKWLSKQPAGEDGYLPQYWNRRWAPPQVRVFIILGKKELANKVAEEVYQQYSSVATLFGCKAWSSDRRDRDIVFTDILEQVRVEPGQIVFGYSWEKHFIRNIQGHLKGKRFLIVVTTYRFSGIYKTDRNLILDSLLHAADGCLPGSAIIMTTDDYDWALSSSPYKIIDARFMAAREFYKAKTTDLLGACPLEIHDIFDLCGPDTFAMKTFLHLLYVNPNRREDELQNYKKAISECRRLKRSISKQVLLWCYNELPSKCRSCLLYLSVFPEGHVIRTTSLSRRWVAEGLVTATSNTSSTASDEVRSSTDEAKHCLDVLFIRGFVSPLEISPEGNIKSCTLHREVWEFIARVATDVNFMDSSLPPHLARYLSIHNRIGLQKSHSHGDSKDIAAYLPALAASPQWQLLKVLDLEGCKGLKKKHMKSICKILLLKYLSLRNTDVTELPKQIKELQCLRYLSLRNTDVTELPMQIKDLQCLETLDIRQAKVRMLANKAIVLPQLKHFLAGHKVSTSNDSTSSEDSFSAVRMPLCIKKMRNMEVLSHVQVSNANELAGIAQLLKLRKLGVALHGKDAKLSNLFLQIEKLNECLRSLSILVDPPAGSGIQDATGMVDPLPSTPQFIERLNISGITGGLRHLIQEHHNLTKITLCETHLKEDDLTVLGKLGALHCLRLLHNSYTESEIVFRGEEFKSLNYLLVEGKDITKISFASGAAPKLERMVWSFARMDALTGLNHLSKLKKLELNGDCDLDPIEEELFWHPNTTLKHKPHHQRQEDRSAAPTSSSSAP